MTSHRQTDRIKPHRSEGRTKRLTRHPPVTVGFRTSDGWVGLGWVDAVKQLARATRTSGRPGWRAPLARRGQWGCRPSRRTPARQRMSGDQRRMMAPGGGRHSREQKIIGQFCLPQNSVSTLQNGTKTHYSRSRQIRALAPRAPPRASCSCELLVRVAPDANHPNHP